MNYTRILFLLIISLIFATHALADKTTLAGGCFWCMEPPFDALPPATPLSCQITREGTP